MARDGLRAFVCAGFVLGAACLVARAGDDPEARIRRQLAVQASLEQGLEHLQRGEYAQAVAVLEKRISHIDGNRRYLNALRDAYRGYLREMRQAGQAEGMEVYIKRLELLDPDWEKVVGGPPPAPRAGSLARVEGAPKVRGQDADPFAPTNSATYRRAESLVSEAEQHFDKKNYLDAARLYARAHAASPEAVRPCRDRYAYCILSGVVQSLNGAGAEGLDRANLEKEVRRALSLSEKLGTLGEDLLRKIRSRAGGGSRTDWEQTRVSVAHGGEQVEGWEVARTANFEIFHHLKREEVERVARIAEGARAAMGRKWFGEDLETWQPRCTVYLHADVEAYARETRAPRSSPGHSTFQFDGGRVLSRRIDLRLDIGHALDAVLPHETTHVVLAGRFGRHQVPRWADEGMAVLAEPPERAQRHLRDLAKYRAGRQLYRMDQLLRLNDYPQARYVSAFYAESVSVVGFLVGLKGPQAFARFLQDGLDTGYEGALRRHYGFDGYGPFQEAWIRHAFHSGTAPGGVASR